jgi:copper chaperone CopZ
MLVQPGKGRGSAILRIKHDPSSSKPDYTKIRASLNSLPGILNVSVNEVTNLVKVEFDPDLLTLEDIRQTIDYSENSEKV